MRLPFPKIPPPPKSVVLLLFLKIRLTVHEKTSVCVRVCVCVKHLCSLARFQRRGVLGEPFNMEQYGWAFGPTMPNQVKDLLNGMFRECVDDKTLNQLKDIWFNATSPCVQPEERGDGARLEFLGMLVFMSLYMNANVYACMMSVSNVQIFLCT